MKLGEFDVAHDALNDTIRTGGNLQDELGQIPQTLPAASLSDQYAQTVRDAHRVKVLPFAHDLGFVPRQRAQLPSITMDTCLIIPRDARRTDDVESKIVVRQRLRWEPVSIWCENEDMSESVLE